MSVQRSKLYKPNNLPHLPVCDAAGSWVVCVCVRRKSGGLCLRSVGASWAVKNPGRERTRKPGRTFLQPSPATANTSKTGSPTLPVHRGMLLKYYLCGRSPVYLKCDLCPSHDMFSRSQSKLLESLEVIPRHSGPITAERYDAIRLYLIKVNRPTGADF